MSRIRQVFADRPWLAIVVGLGFMMTLTISFLVIACLHPPTVLN